MKRCRACDRRLPLSSFAPFDARCRECAEVRLSDRERAVALRTMGMRNADIARTLGRSSATVMGWCGIEGAIQRARPRSRLAVDESGRRARSHRGLIVQPQGRSVA